MMTQSTSPFRAREAFWCIHNTLKSISIAEKNLQVRGLHVLVPTFGMWGFNLASFEKIQPQDIKLTVPCRFLTQDFIATMFNFPADMDYVTTGISTLNSPLVVNYYRKGYHQYLD